MKTNNIRTAIITILLCLLPMVAGAIYYNQLPNDMPMHFAFDNQPDLYGPKPFVLFGIPVIMAALQAIILLFFTAATKQMVKKTKLLSVVTWFVPLLSIFIYALVLVFALGNEINIGRYILLLIGVFFCILGNYLPKSSYEQMKNYMHPAPKDEKSFRKTTKITGYGLLALGAASLILAWLV